MDGDGLTFSFGIERLDERLRRLVTAVSDFSDVTPAIATVLENSVRRNFREGGRPVRWRASGRADGDAAYGNDSGQTLVDTARLMNSIIGAGDRDSARVGTNVAYAAAHHFGIDKQISQQVRAHVRRITQAFGRQIPMTEVRVKSHSRSLHMKLPARPFMLVQDEDWDTIGEIVTEKLQNTLGG